MRIRTLFVSTLLAACAVLGGAGMAAADDGPQELTPREQAGLEAATSIVDALLGGGVPIAR
ncbi:hypothetical protein ACFV9W_18465 [Streptomyces sp. NPDC059897]|uniref:hypothetical protein n=1 Tax=Streptomyces sp. NPDC059897 TaxID=3346994 RepID=UPI00364B5555